MGRGNLPLVDHCLVLVNGASTGKVSDRLTLRISTWKMTIIKGKWNTRMKMFELCDRLMLMISTAFQTKLFF